LFFSSENWERAFTHKHAAPHAWSCVAALRAERVSYEGEKEYECVTHGGGRGEMDMKKNGGEEKWR
jgi:hypothetical protein